MGIFRKATLTLLMATVIFVSESHAQSRSLGTSWSFSGIGVSYDFLESEESFANLEIKAETTDCFMGKSIYPGASASFTWNLIFHEAESRNGVGIDFFAGPGFTAGATPEFMWHNVFFGLKGRIGVRMIYDRKINISVSLAPIIALHLKFPEENMQMALFRPGLLQTAMPEISIKYRF